MRGLLAAGAAVLLTGCQATGPKWDRPGATAADFDREKAECRYEAVKATASGGDFGMRSAVGAGIAEGMKQVEIMTLCMEAKGWVRS